MIPSQMSMFRGGRITDLSSLRGKVLGCWCVPKACHGDVLADRQGELR